MVCGWTYGAAVLDLEELQRRGLDSVALKLLCLVLGDGSHEESNIGVGVWV